jgi:hypothetical protein
MLGALLIKRLDALLQSMDFEWRLVRNTFSESHDVLSARSRAAGAPLRSPVACSVGAQALSL